MSLRTSATEKAYKTAQRNGTLIPLLQEPWLKEYKYWVIIDNRFPHDKHNTRNHMLVLKRNCRIGQVKKREWLELPKIYYLLGHKYDAIKLNLPSMISITDTVHMHLYNFKERNK